MNFNWAEVVGDLFLYFDNKSFIIFKDVLFVHGFWQRLISVSQLIREGYTVDFHTSVTLRMEILFAKAQFTIISII